MNDEYDLILAGGGLANGLIAWELKRRQPQLRVLLVEEQATLGGNHTWSFHQGDLDAEQHRWLDPLVVKRWDRYQVHFANLSREMPSGYASITSERFARVIGTALGQGLLSHTRIASLTPREVLLDNGQILHAAAVIDGRGAVNSRHVALGRQAFVGQLLRLHRPHGLDAPIIMDARVEQGDGYRFVYVLPFSPDTLLVEDTHYIDDQPLAVERLRDNIARYVAAQGWQIAEVLREEQGLLPITLAGDADAFWAEAEGQPRAGLRAGLYHCTTGYSLPHAVRLARWLGQFHSFHSERLFEALRRHALHAWRQQGFYRLLNRMLFLAGEPADRWQVMQRFYRLPEPLITRFYAERLGVLDKLRILTGKPPVPVGAALAAALRFAPRHFERPV
ncbi:lycopene beta-cyclase CrtY [Pseudomonas sp. HR96]|uniref:lycopene beta-cyclase CrtY n=1 Tax=Pseudomonas sp. HR96 TaxID=1027966 RepID=UPI002A759AA9|nr:lycopene beta-cyclase CrtY [Pseudomonas sp. HR96]WPO98036.1 lycopene beta-cyclase CrtY [Pseudomonas sp. HR96]